MIVWWLSLDTSLLINGATITMINLDQDVFQETGRGNSCENYYNINKYLVKNILCHSDSFFTKLLPFSCYPVNSWACFQRLSLASSDHPENIQTTVPVTIYISLLPLPVNAALLQLYPTASSVKPMATTTHGRSLHNFINHTDANAVWII